LKDLLVIDLYEHSLAHSHIAHQNRGLFDILNKNELSLCTGQILLSTKLVVAFLHLCIYNQAVSLGLSHLFNMNIYNRSIVKVLLEGEKMPVIVMEYIFFKSKLHELELVRNF